MNNYYKRYKDEVKSKQLGLNFSTATNRLKKQLLYSLVQECGRDICYRCGNRILSAEMLSVDHKEPWLHSNEAQALFFDLNNIAFSHLSCNAAAARKGS